MLCSRHGRNHRHFSSLDLMSSLQVRNWRSCCRTFIGQAELPGVAERAIEPDALAARLAGDLDSWELFARADLQVGEGLVVFQILVELGADVLDHPRLGEHGGDGVGGFDEVHVADEADPVADAAVVGGLLGEVRAGPRAEVLGLADVDDVPAFVLHQVDAGPGGELADLGDRIIGHEAASCETRVHVLYPCRGLFVLPSRSISGIGDWRIRDRGPRNIRNRCRGFGVRQPPACGRRPTSPSGSGRDRSCNRRRSGRAKRLMRGLRRGRRAVYRAVKCRTSRGYLPTGDGDWRNGR